MFNNFNRITGNNAYLIEIDEELKFFITNKKLDDVKDLHDIIYKDYNVIWSVNYLSEYTKQFIEKNLQNPDNDGFYSDLEGLDLDQLKHILNSLNSSLSSFQSFFKVDVQKKPELLIPFTDVRDQTNISTRNGNPLSKNLGLRKLPSIWNTNSYLEDELKADNKIISSSANDIGSLLPYNDMSLGNLCSIAEEKYSCFIYYNKHYSKVVVLDKQIDIDIFPELKYINTIDGTEDDIVSLREALEHNLFFNVEQLEVFIKYYNVKDKTMTQQKLKKFIKKHFSLNNKIEHKIKFTTLFNKITELMLLKADNIQEKKTIKQLLPKVLKNLKLSKKRYKDGNYWYGIELKEIKETDVAKLFRNMMKERNNEAQLKIGGEKIKWVGDKNDEENDGENDEENDEKESKMDPSLMEDISTKVNQLVSLFISNNNSDIVNTIINNLDLDSNLPRTSTSSFEVVDI